MLFRGYLDGLGLQNAADQAGIPVNHSQAKRMMLNQKYLGTDYYPAIVTQEMLDSVKTEFLKRAKKLGRIYEPKEKIVKPVVKDFIMKTPQYKYEDPYCRAEYLYGLIEEVQADG